MKPTALLAVAIFLVCAPSPDSKTISELSHGFLSDTKIQPLLANESYSIKSLPTALVTSEKDDTPGNG